MAACRLVISHFDAKTLSFEPGWGEARIAAEAGVSIEWVAGCLACGALFSGLGDIRGFYAAPVNAFWTAAVKRLRRIHTAAKALSVAKAGVAKFEAGYAYEVAALEALKGAAAEWAALQ
jgi:hypothetical protein